MGRVNDDFEIVVQLLGNIAPQFCSNDSACLRVEALDPEIDLSFGVHNTNFSSFGRRPSLERLPLQEVRDRSGLAPDGIIKSAIQLRTAIDPDRACCFDFWFDRCSLLT